MGDPEHEVRVLVVDDSEDAADGLTAILSSARYAAQAAYNGKSALAAASTFRPHVVLLDIDMPHMNGYLTAQGLRQLDFDEPPVLIAHTGHSDVASVAATAAAGFDMHVSKPCEVRDLLEMLEKTLLDRRRDQ